jgi:alpha-galactosidase
MTSASTTNTAGWSIDLANLALRWAVSATGDLELVSLVTAGSEWISTPTPLFDLPFTGISVTQRGDSLRIDGLLGDKGLRASVSWTSYPESSVVRSEVRVRNASDTAISLGAVPSLRLTVPATRGSQLAMLAGGRWDESMPPRGYRLTTYDLDEYSRGRTKGVADDGRSSGEWIPWFALTNATGGLFAGLVWSGRWHLRSGRADQGVSLWFGISDFAHELAPGEEIELPGVVLSGYAGDLDAGSQQWRDWIRDSWTPPTPDDWPWVQYNHWYAWYGDIDQERLLTEARFAAEAGCEVFVIDDGWFVGRRPDSYHAGWGNWVEDRAKFPDGLHAFGDRIRELGMRFGLWVEPERAAIDSPVLTAHPDWIARRDGVPLTRPDDVHKGSAHLCFGNPDVQQWVIEDIVRVVREYGVDWLKWDYNVGYGLGCNVADHGHQATDGHWAHTHGLYRVFAGIREQCPDLMIENCASGGHRVDLGTLRHTHTNWVSDYTNRAESCRQHTQGAGLFMPLAHLNTWVLERRDEVEFHSRFGGAFGVSWFLEAWSEEDRLALRDAIGEYKRIRPLLNGKRYLLTGPLHQAWDIWQLESSDGSGSAILAFRDGGHIDRVHIQPHLIDLSTTWRVESSSGEPETSRSGNEGLNLHIAEPRGSLILWLHRDQ